MQESSTNSLHDYLNNMKLVKNEKVSMMMTNSFYYNQLIMVRTKIFNPLSADPTKSSNTLKQFVGNGRQNVWVFDRFVGLTLKGLIRLRFNRCLSHCQPRKNKRKHFHINRFTFLTNGLPSLLTVEARVVATPWSTMLAWSERSPVFAIKRPSANTAAART